MASCSLNRALGYLECSICLEFFEDPRELNCSHVFCRTPCLDNLVDKETLIITCPLCRASQKMSDGGVSHLPVNKILRDIIEAAREKSSKSGPDSCEVCGMFGETSRCRHCVKYICAECHKRHIRNMKEDLEQLITYLEGETTGSIHRLNQSEDSMKSMQESVMSAMQSISNVFSEVVNAVNKRRDALLLELDTFLMTETTKLSEVMQGRETLVEILNTCRQTKEILEENALPKVIEKFDKDLREKLALVLRTIDTPVAREARFEMQYQTIAEVIEKTGSIIYIEKQPDALVIKMSSTNNDTLKKPITRESEEISRKPEQKHDDIEKTPASAELPKPCPIKILGTARGTFKSIVSVCMSHVTGDIAVSDRLKHAVVVFNRLGEFRQKLGGYGASIGQFDIPAGMSFDGDGRLLVVDHNNHRIQVYDKKYNFIRKISTFGTSSYQLNGPWDVMSFGDSILVADVGNDRIMQFNKNGGGSYLCDIAKRKYNLPNRIGINPVTNHVFVSDSNGVCWFVMSSLDGKHFRDITSETPLARYVKTNSVIAFDDSGRLIISNHPTTVEIYNAHGKLASFESELARTRGNPVRSLAADGATIVVAGSTFLEIHTICYNDKDDDN